MIIFVNKDQPFYEQIMVTSFSQFSPAKVLKISASILGKVKKIEAENKKLVFLKIKRVYLILIDSLHMNTVCLKYNRI